MLKKLAAIAALALVALLALVPFAPEAGAQSYGPRLPTQTHVTVVKAVAGQPLVVRISVTAADGTSPSGSIAYTVGSGSAAARSRVLLRAAAAGTAHVNGSAITVTGGTARAGSYLAGASFSPDNAARYLPSSGSDRAVVGAAANQGGSSGGGVAGGGLPNTGGPAFGWLIAGVALLGAGAGAVGLSRRRVPTAA